MPHEEPDIQPLLRALRQRLTTGVDASEMKGGFWLASLPDAVAARFIRGNHYSVDEAFQMLMETAKWRYSFGVDELMKKYETDESPDRIILEGHWPRGRTGLDKRGKPVLYNHLTGVDFPSIIEQLGMDALTVATVYEFERNLRDNPEGGSIMVFDLGLEGLSASFQEVRAWIQALMLYVKKLAFLANFYPEQASQIFFIRAPKLFYGTFKVAETFLPDRTIKKVKVLSGDPLASLIEFMDISCVPPELGGTSKVVVGLGGRLPPNAKMDAAFMAEMKERFQLVRGSSSKVGKERYSLIRAKQEEEKMQESLALELLKEQIEMAKRGSVSAEQRGSWRFDPGLDVLDKTPDDVLLRELKSENFDPVATLAKLRKEAIKNSDIKVPTGVETANEAQLLDAAKEAASKDFNGQQQGACVMM